MINRVRKMLLFLGLTASAVATGDKTARSPNELRELLLAFHERGDVEAAKSLFCRGETAQRIKDMYNRSMEDIFSLTIISADIQEIPKDRQPSTTHLAKPELRLMLNFSEKNQPEIVKASQFFYIGKTSDGYCFSIPKI